VFVEQVAKLFNLLPRAALRGQRVQHQFSRGTVENALQHVGGKLALGLFLRLLRFIDMRALIFVAADETFHGHDLHELEYCRVAESLFRLQRFLDFANRGRSALPENLQDLQLGGGGLLRRGVFHAQHHTTKDFVMSTKIFVVLWTAVGAVGEPPETYTGRTAGRVMKRRSLENPDKAGRRVGLARVLSKLGFCSRSRAVDLIRAGRVRLNGVSSRNPEAPVRLGRDLVEVDGVRIERSERSYWMLNKPRGLVSTASDERNRETVYSRLPAGLPWLGPVGRLDKASEGLLLLSNDSEWAATITAPESHLDKTYHVQIAAVADETLLGKLARGVYSDGELLRAKAVRILRRGGKTSWIEVILDEGKNRQIRRMLDGCGVGALRLIRVAVGPLLLGSLGKGEARELTVSEKAALDKALGRF
jgi:23S rRNA pseudouridine2605 synthase